MNDGGGGTGDMTEVWEQSILWSFNSKRRLWRFPEDGKSGDTTRRLSMVGGCCLKKSSWCWPQTQSREEEEGWMLEDRKRG